MLARDSARSRQDGLDGFHQRLRAVGFAQVLDAVGNANPFCRHRTHIATRDECGDIGCDFTNVLQHFLAAHVGHGKVEDHHGNLVAVLGEDFYALANSPPAAIQRPIVSAPSVGL